VHLLVSDPVQGLSEATSCSRSACARRAQRLDPPADVGDGPSGAQDGLAMLAGQRRRRWHVAVWARRERQRPARSSTGAPSGKTS
jgi:hypothetical protein